MNQTAVRIEEALQVIRGTGRKIESRSEQFYIQRDTLGMKLARAQEHNDQAGCKIVLRELAAAHVRLFEDVHNIVRGLFQALLDTEGLLPPDDRELAREIERVLTQQMVPLIAEFHKMVNGWGREYKSAASAVAKVNEQSKKDVAHMQAMLARFDNPDTDISPV